MKDFDRYSKEFFLASKSFKIEKVLRSYQLPNLDELHNMICGYGESGNFDDVALFNSAESIDFEMYEKELWKLEKK